MILIPKHVEHIHHYGTLIIRRVFEIAPFGEKNLRRWLQECLNRNLKTTGHRNLDASGRTARSF